MLERCFGRSASRTRGGFTDRASLVEISAADGEGSVC
jgi:hypothetical protein